MLTLLMAHLTYNIQQRFQIKNQLHVDVKPQSEQHVCEHVFSLSCDSWGTQQSCCPEWLWSLPLSLPPLWEMGILWRWNSGFWEVCVPTGLDGGSVPARYQWVKLPLSYGRDEWWACSYVSSWCCVLGLTEVNIKHWSHLQIQRRPRVCRNQTHHRCLKLVEYFKIMRPLSDRKSNLHVLSNISEIMVYFYCFYHSRWIILPVFYLSR